MTVSNSRKTIADFTDEVYNQRIGAYIRLPGRQGLQWTDFMAPFSSGLWTAATGAALLLATTLTLALRAPPSPTPSPAATSSSPAARDLVAPRDAWLFVAAAFCQQGQRMPGAWSVRVLCVCAHLAALVLAAAHSGALISALSAGSPRLPFNSLKEALDDPRTRFIISSNTTYFDRLLQHSEDSEWTRLVTRLEVTPRATDEVDSLQRTCAGDRTVCFLGAEGYPLISRFLECDITRIPFSSLHNPTGFAFAKGNPYVEAFNSCLRRMRRAGVLARVVRTHWPRALASLEGQRHPGVRLSDVVPVFAALFVGALLAFVVLAGERFFFLRRRTSPHRIYVYRNDASHVCTVQPAVPR